MRPSALPAAPVVVLPTTRFKFSQSLDSPKHSRLKYYQAAALQKKTMPTRRPKKLDAKRNTGARFRGAYYDQKFSLYEKSRPLPIEFFENGAGFFSFVFKNRVIFSV